MIAIVSNMSCLPSFALWAATQVPASARPSWSVFCGRGFEWRLGRDGLRWTQRECHRPVDDSFAVDACHAFQEAHATPQPHDDGFYFDHVAGMDGTPIAHALDAGEKRKPLPVLRLRENEDRADLGDGLSQDGRREHRRA